MQLARSWPGSSQETDEPLSNQRIVGRAAERPYRLINCRVRQAPASPHRVERADECVVEFRMALHADHRSAVISQHGVLGMLRAGERDGALGLVDHLVLVADGERDRRARAIHPIAGAYDIIGVAADAPALLRLA